MLARDACLARRLVGDGEAEDVAAEALETAWRRRSTFDAHRGSVRSWLLSITADRARKSWRRRRIRPAPNEELDRAAHDAYPDTDLHRALSALPARQRLAVELHYFLQLPIAEVAQTMRCAEGTVKSTLAHARTALRTHLRDDHR